MQIAFNLSVIFVWPFLFGGFIRFACRKSSKAWLITVIAAIFFVASWLAALALSSNGSELYGLTTMEAACFTVASLLVGLFVRIRKGK